MNKRTSEADSVIQHIGSLQGKINHMKFDALQSLQELEELELITDLRNELNNLEKIMLFNMKQNRKTNEEVRPVPQVSTDVDYVKMIKKIDSLSFTQKCSIDPSVLRALLARITGIEQAQEAERLAAKAMDEVIEQAQEAERLALQV